MQIFNLDPQFQPYGPGVEFKQFTFPSGFEHHIKIPESISGIGTVTVRISSSDDVMKLILMADALDRVGIQKHELFIAYLPYARQDRVMVPGEPLSLKIIGNLINQLGFSMVTILDPHSSGVELVIDNCRTLDNAILVNRVLETINNPVIVSPDAGAGKKIFKLCKSIGYKNEIMLCDKDRDVTTGYINDITTDGTDVTGRNVVIIDDICDGGMTFILLSQKLKELGAQTVTLVVTHGIFSKGEDRLRKTIDRIYTTNSINDKETDFITRFPVKTLLS